MGRTADHLTNCRGNRDTSDTTVWNTGHYSEPRKGLDQYLNQEIKREREQREQRMLDEEQKQHDREKARRERANEVERAQKATDKSPRLKESCVMM